MQKNVSVFSLYIYTILPKVLGHPLLMKSLTILFYVAQKKINRFETHEGVNYGII